MTELGKVSEIWATRPAPQNTDWMTLLQPLGCKVVELPLLQIAPVSDPDAEQAIKNLIMDFDQFQKVIFVSQNAVRYTFEWLEDFWPQLPLGIEYFAVGDKTAESVKEQKLDVVAGVAAMNSDELLSLPQLQEVWGQRILICRGFGGLPKLGEVLHERGAVVRYCELYLRQVPPEATDRVRQRVAETLSSRIIVPVFSGETLQNLERLLPSSDDSVKDRLQLVVPGKRVAQLAETLGFQHVQMAKNASQQEMFSAVNELKEALV